MRVFTVDCSVQLVQFILSLSLATRPVHRTAGPRAPREDILRAVAKAPAAQKVRNALQARRALLAHRARPAAAAADSQRPAARAPRRADARRDFFN